MKKLKSIALAVLMGVSLSGCEDKLFDNVNPDVAHKNTAELGLPVLVFYASQSVYDHAEYNIYLSQCLTTMGKSQTGTYAYKEGWQFLTMNRHPQWRRHFYDIGVNGNELIKNSQSMGSPNFELIARTIMLMSTQLTTDAFGDMPRSEAYKSNSPTYDTQASIYKWMFEEADELIKMYEDPALTAPENNYQITSKMDRIYKGDLNKWKGLVYAVKARLLLRNIPNIDRSSAKCQEIINTAQKAIDTWRSGDLLYGAWFGNEPRFNFDGGTGEQNAQWSEAQPKINSWESRDNKLTDAVPSKFFMENCLGVIFPGDEMKQGFFDRGNGYGSDPRLALLFKPRNGPISPSKPTQNRVMLRYLENNIGAGSTYKATHMPILYCGAYAGGNDAYTPLFTMEELYFIQAEAYYWMGDKVKACELAKEATQWNIQRHLDRFLADNNGSYPASEGKPGTASDKTRFERQLTAFFENEKVSTTKPCTAIGNKHWFFNPSDYKLSDLMMQKYIAMYMQPEQWTDLRRYHYSNNRNGYGIGDQKEIVYPGLRRPYNLYQAFWIDGLTNDEKENCWVQRINYDPETEVKYNMKELIRLGAYNNHEWLRKPMNWALEYGQRSSLTAE
ncbi:MAG: SusD/RagB family nutrient-binding outer membrane lipoprotein [Muribaculaceae bacterium]|nr:SusD/RagB family nutrient-binding outer membrane lipoprotein [Muribaculaceae bacterium]